MKDRLDEEVLLQVALSEYTSLREETLKRVEIGHQILNYMLVAFGVLFTVSQTGSKPPQALLSYPVVAFGFALAFTHNAFLLTLLGTYIREKLEKERLRNCEGWANYLYSRHSLGAWSDIIAPWLIFLGTQGIAILVASSTSGVTNSWLFCISVGAFILTALLALCAWPLGPLLLLLLRRGHEFVKELT